jgi:hypothetical protein
VDVRALPPVVLSQLHPSRSGNQTLGFYGSGEGVLGRFLTLLLLPFSIATGGLMFGVITWMCG